MSVIEGKQCCSEWKAVLIENHVNRESKSLELTIQLYHCYDEIEAPRIFNTAVYLSWLLHLEGVLGVKGSQASKSSHLVSSQL